MCKFGAGPWLDFASVVLSVEQQETWACPDISLKTRLIPGLWKNMHYTTILTFHPDRAFPRRGARGHIRGLFFVTPPFSNGPQ